MKKKSAPEPTLYAPPPRDHASLDHWVGHMSHMATGVSTDPAMRDPRDVATGPKRTKGHEPEALGATPNLTYNRAGLETGTSSIVWERPMMTERASLEREIRRLREIIAVSEAALHREGISAADRTWVRRQFGLRQLRLGRLVARLHALRPPRNASGRKNQRKPMARLKLNSRGKGSGWLGEN